MKNTAPAKALFSLILLLITELPAADRNCNEHLLFTDDDKIIEGFMVRVCREKKSVLISLLKGKIPPLGKEYEVTQIQRLGNPGGHVIAQSKTPHDSCTFETNLAVLNNIWQGAKPRYEQNLIAVMNLSQKSNAKYFSRHGNRGIQFNIKKSRLEKIDSKLIYCLDPNHDE